MYIFKIYKSTLNIRLNEKSDYKKMKSSVSADCHVTSGLKMRLIRIINHLLSKLEIYHYSNID